MGDQGMGRFIAIIAVVGTLVLLGCIAAATIGRFS